ncbi:hypothetical protein M1349_04675 [Patescibacteria group bacterium]|nr:hypothetical protein [Patescibacteria group bacterium]
MTPEGRCTHSITVEPESPSNGIPVVHPTYVEELVRGLHDEEIRMHKIGAKSAPLLKYPSVKFMGKHGVGFEWSGFMNIAKRMLTTYSYHVGPLPIPDGVDLYQIGENEIDQGITSFKKFNPGFCEYIESQLDTPYVIIEDDQINEVAIPKETDIVLSMFGLMEAAAARCRALI